MVKELISHWEENGRDAIDRTCKEQPAAYLRAVLSLVPKDFAMTVERDETSQDIRIEFVNAVSGAPEITKSCHGKAHGDGLGHQSNWKEMP